MPDYQKCMIYKLICDEEPHFLYVGNTTNWNRRKALHKNDSLDSTKKVYQNIRELGWENIKMVWIEDYPCNNKREGEAREQYWMDTLKSTMNSQKAFRTEEQKKENRKARYENNKETVAKQHKEYYENNKEAILEQKKEYQKENKDKLDEKNKEYREEHKEQIAARNNTKCDCECGGKYTLMNQARHFRTKLHQDWLHIVTCVEVQRG
jgi:hypothetical protein